MEGIITKCMAFSISSFVTTIKQCSILNNEHVLLGQASKPNLDPNLWSHKRPTNSDGLAGETWKNTDSTDIYGVTKKVSIAMVIRTHECQIQEVSFFGGIVVI